MNELIKSIIFAILGATVLGFGIELQAGAEVIVLGALITVVAIAFIVKEVITNKKS